MTSAGKVLLLAVWTTLCGLLPTPACAAAIGIVLLHELEGSPDGIIAPLAATLTAAGYPVERPEMCWSRARIYDRSYDDCLRDVDDAIARLKARGATAIVVAGLSIGGNAALAYGASHDGLKGIIALGPAHAPSHLVEWPAVAASVAKAEAMVAVGRGEASDDFADVYTSVITVRTTPQIYLSFFGPHSPADIAVNAAHLRAPLLWVAGTGDPTQRGGTADGFAKVPANPLNRYVTVRSNHLGTPDAARAVVLAWLRELD